MSNTGSPEPLARLQAAFAGTIRNPDSVPAPAGIDPERMQLYRDLFFTNISKFLASNFPVLRRLYEGPAWTRLVRDFYSEHRAHSPLFPEIGKEFLRYLEEQRQNRPGDPPFMYELAHYEWVELAVSLDQTDLELIPIHPDADVFEGIPVLSPLARSLAYRYPVHRISPEFQPAEPPDEMTHLLVYRNRADDVRFMQLNEATQFLLLLMSQQPQWTGRQLLERTAERIGHPDPQAAMEYGRQLLADLLGRDVILGARLPKG